MLGSPEKSRFAAFRIARTGFRVGRSRVNCDRCGAVAPPEWPPISVSPNIGAPRLAFDRLREGIAGRPGAPHESYTWPTR